MTKKWKFLIIAIAGFVFLLGAILFTMYHETKTAVDQKMHRSVFSIDQGVAAKKLKELKPLTILLLGVDEREGDKGRSDTIMVLHLNPSDESSHLISIPRDTRTTLKGDAPENGKQDKINHSYAYGGTDMAVETVEQFLNTDIDYYVKVNMEGLQELVNTLGDVTVENRQSFSSNGFDFPEGEISLNGEKALAYVQMRKDDSLGDAGRNARQRQLIEEIFIKGTSVTSVNKFGAIMNTLGDNVSTNMDFKEMKALVLHYRSARNNIEHYQMTGMDTMIQEIYYLTVPQEEIEKVSSLITAP